MAPDIDVRLCVVVPPRIAVIPAFTRGIPAKAKPIAHRLLCHAYVDGPVVDAHDI